MPKISKSGNNWIKNQNAYTKEFLGEFIEVIDFNDLSPFLQEAISNVVISVYNAYYAKFFNDNSAGKSNLKLDLDLNFLLLNIFVTAYNYTSSAYINFNDEKIDKSRFVFFFNKLLLATLNRLATYNIDAQKTKDEFWLEFESFIEEESNEMLLEMLGEDKNIPQQEPYPKQSWFCYIFFTLKSNFSKEKRYETLKSILDNNNLINNYLLISMVLTFVMTLSSVIIFFIYDKHLSVVPFSIFIAVLFLGIQLLIIKWTLKIYSVKKEVEMLSKCDKYTLYERYGVDPFSIHISNNITELVDFAKKNELVPAITDYRLKLFDNMGFLFPAIRLVDESCLKNNEMVFFIRAHEVLRTKIYPDRYIVKKEVAQRENLKIPDNSILIENAEIGDVYWVEENFCKKLDADFYLVRQTYYQEIINYLAYKYLDKLFTIENAECIMQVCRARNEGYYSLILKNLNIYQIRDTFVELLKQQVSIVDILYIVEKIYYNLQKTTDPQVIASNIKIDFLYSYPNAHEYKNWNNILD